MRRYATAVDLRRALEARLKQQAEESGTDLSRLRRVAVFDRIAARLPVADKQWVLKGGTSLEFRLGARARATKDLDLAFLDVPARMIESVDRRQHFAEKLHAFTRDYGARPNTRVKDLVDMVLLIEDGLSAEESLLGVVRHVFTVRATHPVPETIPDPPPVWATDYPKLAEDRTLTEPDLATALGLLRTFWAQALTTETEI